VLLLLGSHVFHLLRDLRAQESRIFDPRLPAHTYFLDYPVKHLGADQAYERSEAHQFPIHWD
jgi:hypothetical protein